MEHKELKEMLSTTKKNASPNLKIRVMHQINSEKVLIPVRKNNSTSMYGFDFSLFGVMYLILLSLFAYFYFKTDSNPFQSALFTISTFFIASSFSFYWLLMNYLDSKSRD